MTFDEGSAIIAIERWRKATLWAIGHLDGSPEFACGFATLTAHYGFIADPSLRPDVPTISALYGAHLINRAAFEIEALTACLHPVGIRSATETVQNITDALKERQDSLLRGNDGGSRTGRFYPQATPVMSMAKDKPLPPGIYSGTANEFSEYGIGTFGSSTNAGISIQRISETQAITLAYDPVKIVDKDA